MPKDKSGQFGTLNRAEEETEAEEQNDGVLFYVNTGGFPINNRVWDRMWDHVARIHPDGYKVATKIRKAKDLAEVLTKIGKHIFRKKLKS